MQAETRTSRGQIVSLQGVDYLLTFPRGGQLGDPYLSTHLANLESTVGRVNGLGKHGTRTRTISQVDMSNN